MIRATGKQSLRKESSSLAATNRSISKRRQRGLREYGNFNNTGEELREEWSRPTANGKDHR